MQQSLDEELGIMNTAYPQIGLQAAKLSEKTSSRQLRTSTSAQPWISYADTESARYRIETQSWQGGRKSLLGELRRMAVLMTKLRGSAPPPKVDYTAAYRVRDASRAKKCDAASRDDAKAVSEAAFLRKSHPVVVEQQVRVRKHDIPDLGNGRCVSLHDERIRC
ncbi:hypothetical protein BDP55DRAFT_633041 [Colletotrichum godetiae]|uniref:Uncharacterized protein n=1 Tax=Colletotrichum godetiae TaxID=1209918 RepID=A0AAJ0AJW7_9PEZI|nr:uncharacterized protein BDP55DRAFT_633041 [Colletotrichum godetiae]KAK1674600.1 hypothetical protein BDP55DRAFT_633041 [Colletotrichum godetiae]